MPLQGSGRRKLPPPFSSSQWQCDPPFLVSRWQPFLSVPPLCAIAETEISIATMASAIFFMIVSPL